MGEDWLWVEGLSGAGKSSPLSGFFRVGSMFGIQRGCSCSGRNESLATQLAPFPYHLSEKLVTSFKRDRMSSPFSVSL